MPSKRTVLNFNNMKYILALLLLINTCSAQTLYVADNMENPSGWRGTSNSIGISLFTGGISLSSDNPPSYQEYASPDSCYMIKGNGLGSSAVENDTFTYSNLPVIAGRTYEIRYKIASFGLNYLSNTAAGVDGGDTLEFQYRLANSAWFRDAKIIGNNNSMWSFDGAIGTNAKLAINRNANTTPNVYVSNPTNPITSMSIRLNPGVYTTIQIRFITKINATGETFMLDDVEVWDVTGTLPIELVNFYGKHYGENIKLFWTTASEINNDYFIIYKSSDGINYSELDRVDGSGNSNVYMNYEYLDNQICDTIVYYKLRQVDYDGKYTESDPIAMQCREKDNSGEMKCYDILGREINNDYNGIKFYK